MDNQFSPNWNCKFITNNAVVISHSALCQLSQQELPQFFPHASVIQKQKDDTVMVVFPRPTKKAALSKIFDTLDQKAFQQIKTPHAYIERTHSNKTRFKSWFITFEGCLALLLTHDESTKPFLIGDWDFVNSTAGGIQLYPFTLFLHRNYPKIIHPTTTENVHTRKVIEHTAATITRALIRRFIQAQQGFEGVALLSLVTHKTKLSEKEIVESINDKSFGIKNPTSSPFLEEVL